MPEDLCGWSLPGISVHAPPEVQPGEEIPAKFEEMNSVLGHQESQGIVADDLDSGNRDITFPTSARSDRPVIDCDSVGRLESTVRNCTPYLCKCSLKYCCLTDANGDVSMVKKTENPSTGLELRVSRISRSAVWLVGECDCDVDGSSRDFKW